MRKKNAGKFVSIAAAGIGLIAGHGDPALGREPRLYVSSQAGNSDKMRVTSEEDILTRQDFGSLAPLYIKLHTETDKLFPLKGRAYDQQLYEIIVVLGEIMEHKRQNPSPREAIVVCDETAEMKRNRLGLAAYYEQLNEERENIDGLVQRSSLYSKIQKGRDRLLMRRSKEILVPLLSATYVCREAWLESHHIFPQRAPSAQSNSPQIPKQGPKKGSRREGTRRSGPRR